MGKNEELNQFIKEELIKLHKITLLEEQKTQIEDKLRLLTESTNTVVLTFLRTDEGTGNFLYKGSDGDVYVSIDGVIYTLTNAMEPDYPVHNTIVKPGEPIYNPEDRFGRNPGSKLQTEIKNENEQINPLTAHAKDFISNVLKMGSKQNLFDVYMQSHNIRPDLLHDFIQTVKQELEGEWW